MLYSDSAIIKHIPDFLEEYENKGFSLNTIINYERYLKDFVSWLKKNKKEDLKPHELTIKDIESYKLYLSNKKIKDSTRNYYLIGLRAFLSYFSSKDIVSPLPSKITLIKEKKSFKKHYLDKNHIKRILLLPNISAERGLRDRAILETLIYSGLKVNQLIKLDRSLENSYLTKRSLFWVKKYLDKREDKNKSVFINYKNGRRLTARSVQRITNRYGRKINLQFPLTPEILRWSFVKTMIDRDKSPIPINKIYQHGFFLVDNYRYDENIKNDPRLKSKEWKVVEKYISKFELRKIRLRGRRKQSISYNLYRNRNSIFI